MTGKSSWSSVASKSMNRSYTSFSRSEQRPQIGGFSFGRQFRDAGFGVGIDDRKIELVLSGVQIDEQIVHLVQPIRTAAANRWIQLRASVSRCRLWRWYR